MTFDPNGGTGGGVLTTGADGKLAALPGNPAWEGYRFDGWFTARDGGTRVTVSTVFQTDTTVYAHWTPEGGTPPGPDDPKTYTVTFDPNGGAGGGVLTTGTDGKLAALPPDPARNGYLFGGWFTARDGGTRVTVSTVFQADTTVFAHWSENTGGAVRYWIYTPSRTPGGSLSVSQISAVEGTRVTIEVDPRSNYELDWLLVTNLSTGRELRLSNWYGSEYTFTMPAGDVEVEVSFISRYSGWTSTLPDPPRQVSAKPIRWYYSNGSIYHVTSGLVPTGSPLTRDMLVSVFYNMDDSSSGEQEVWAANHGIVSDIYENWLWGGDKALSREQAAMIFFGYARYRGYNISRRSTLGGYSDYDRIRPVAYPAMSWARAAGLITGTTANTLSPQGILTCGQANAILARFVSNVAWTR